MAHDSVDVGYNLPGKQFAINTLNTGGIGGWPRALGQNLNGAQCNNCALVRNVIDTCLRKILVERSVAGAVDYAKQTISDLLQSKLDISLLVITKVCWRGGWQRERVQRLPHPLHFVPRLVDAQVVVPRQLPAWSVVPRLLLPPTLLLRACTRRWARPPTLTATLLARPTWSLLSA